MDTEELIVDKKEVGMKWNIDIWDTDQDVLLAKRSKDALYYCYNWASRLAQSVSKADTG